MPLILLELDVAAAERVQRLWLRLAAAGLPELGMHGYAPHLTLAVFDELALEPLVARLDGLFRGAGAPGLSFDVLGSFPDAGVLHLVPTPSAELLALQARVYQALAGVAAGCRKAYRPGHWTPHCTLAAKLTPDDLGRAFALCARGWTPVEARASAVALAQEGPPPRDLWRLELR